MLVILACFVTGCSGGGTAALPAAAAALSAQPLAQSANASPTPGRAATPLTVSAAYTNANLPPAGWDPLVTHGPASAPDASRIDWPALCAAHTPGIVCTNGDPAFASDSRSVIAETFPHGSAGVLGWCTTSGYTARYNGAQGSATCQGRDTMSSVFFATNDDPAYTVTCVTYGSCGAGTSGNGTGSLQGESVHIADGSTPSLGGDAHLTILNERANLDCEFWNTEAGGKRNPLEHGGRLQVGNGGCGSLDSGWDGVSNVFVAYGSGVEIVRFLVRPEEVLAGTIPHALYMSVSNNRRGHVWPAAGDDGTCTSPSGGQQGYVYYLDTAGYRTLLASHASALKKTFLTVFHRYGVYDLDSSGCNSPSANYSNFLGWDPLGYTQNGLANPWDAVAKTSATDPDRANDWSQSGDYTLMNLDLSDTGLTASNFHILAPNYPRCAVTHAGC